MIHAKVRTLKGDKLVTAIVAPMAKLGGSVGLKVTKLQAPDTVPLFDCDRCDIPLPAVEAFLAMTAWAVAGHTDTALTVVPNTVFHSLASQLAVVEDCLDNC